MQDEDMHRPKHRLLGESSSNRNWYIQDILTRQRQRGEEMSYGSWT